MKLRAPAYPLITVDPYFSVWSNSDRLNDKETVHWTGKPNPIIGIVNIDGTDYCFMGKSDCEKLRQTDVSVTATATLYTFECQSVTLYAEFTSPLLLNDLDILSRPVSYLCLRAVSKDNQKHNIKAKITVSEEICLNYAGEDDVITESFSNNDINSISIGSVKQPVLAVSGDDIRINWGYFYLSAANAQTETVSVPAGEKSYTQISASIDMCSCGGDVLFTFAYDDIKSMVYFGEQLSSYWNRNGKKITEAISEAHADYYVIKDKCRAFDDRLFIDATRCGGEKYAEILELAYRQTIAAHKVCVDTDGEILFISKECFSNGCAATVDVSYPSIPLYLIYNPELVRGMMRPVIKFARTDKWIFDFAPHDAGQYPLVNGQVYNGTDINGQMPVEECGNMLVMFAAEAIASGKTDFAEKNLDLIQTWVKYLEENGRDPANQLCTDDFAGHLAHNCNLSLKAIMGICGLGLIYKMLGKNDEGEAYINEAREMAADWAKRASNGDGSYKLAFDREGTYSMKYNIIWDKLFGTDIMSREVIAAEFASYRKHMNKYGMPLDNRADYTKSDWLVWCAALGADKDDFAAFIEPLWDAYNYSVSSIPLTD